MGVALDGLGSRDDGHPLLHVLAGGVALAAEEGEVLRSHILIASQAEEEVGAGRVSRGVALRGVGPVQDVGRAVLGDDDVGRIEIAMAHLVVLGHTFQTGMQVVAGSGIQLRLADLSVHLVL